MLGEETRMSSVWTSINGETKEQEDKRSKGKSTEIRLFGMRAHHGKETV